MISVSSLIEELRTLSSHPLIQRTDILDKTRAILKARIYFRIAGCATILSADINSGQQYESLQVVNPFGG